MGADGAEVVLGLVAAPGTPAELADRVRADVAADLARELPGASWRVEVVVDGLVQPPADDAQVVAATRARLLGHDWDLAVCLTDLPLQVARRPVVAHASPVHAVAVVCVPALGAVGVRARLRQTLTGQVRTLLGQDPGGRGPAGAEPPSRCASSAPTRTPRAPPAAPRPPPRGS